MRLLDTETDHESERDLRHTKTISLTHGHTLARYCFVSIDLSQVGSIMHGAGAVKGRTI